MTIPILLGSFLAAAGSACGATISHVGNARGIDQNCQTHNGPNTYVDDPNLRI